MGGEGEERREKRDGREFERTWVLLGKQALNKELIEVLRAKKKREEREKSSFFTDKEEDSVF